MMTQKPHGREIFAEAKGRSSMAEAGDEGEEGGGKTYLNKKVHGLVRRPGEPGVLGRQHGTHAPHVRRPREGPAVGTQLWLGASDPRGRQAVDS